MERGVQETLAYKWIFVAGGEPLQGLLERAARVGVGAGKASAFQNNGRSKQLAVGASFFLSLGSSCLSHLKSSSLIWELSA